MNITALARRLDKIAKRKERGLPVVRRLALDEGTTIPTDDGEELLIIRVFCEPNTRGCDGTEECY